MVLDQEVHEGAANELVIGPADDLAERPIGPDARVVDISVADPAAAVEDDHDARDRLERRRRGVALALELELAAAALGDVDAAGDDSRDVSGRIVDGRRAPEDGERLSAQVGELVLVLAHRELRRERLEARDDVVSLLR